MDTTLRLALETISMQKQAIIFVPSRASAEKQAEEIAKNVKLFLPDLADQILKAASSPTRQCRRLSNCTKKAIAFHHAGLIQKQRDIIEQEFRKGTIRIICATPTLAAGLSLPVFRVIIKSLKRYSPRWGMDYIPVLEYLQMAGRAGRPEFEKYGEAISIATTQPQKEELYEKYICGKPEDIYSKLAVEPVLRTYLLSLISSRIITGHQSMLEFFTKTFWAHQFKDLDKLQLILDRMLNLLQEWGFVVSSSTKAKNINQDFIVASDLATQDTSATFRATRLGKRVSELYLDPLTARTLLDCLLKYDDLKSDFSVLQMISGTLEMRPRLRVKAKEHDIIHQELLTRSDQLLQEEPNSFDLDFKEFLNSIKTALFFENWINEKNEEFLLENFDIRPGEIHIKCSIADWLLYCCEEFTKINERKELLKTLRKLRVRIKNGVKAQLLPLLKFKGIGRVRARKLYKNSIKDAGDVKRVSITSLAQIIGPKAASSIKKQVGEKVEPIKPTKRKGQMSLHKF